MRRPDFKYSTSVSSFERYSVLIMDWASIATGGPVCDKDFADDAIDQIDALFKMMRMEMSYGAAGEAVARRERYAESYHAEHIPPNLHRCYSESVDSDFSLAAIEIASSVRKGYGWNIMPICAKHMDNPKSQVRGER